MATYTGKPCKYGHSGLRYTRNHACVECIKERVKEHKRKQRAAGVPRKPYLKHKFPVPLVCESCHQPDPAGKKICFDHCHTTGVHRGYLCHGCNTALGLLKDDPVRIRALAEYIEAHIKGLTP